MTKTVLAMTSVKADGSEALEKYLAVVTPLMEAAGARLICRYEVAENLFDSELPQYISNVEYPPDQAIRMVFEHPDFCSLRQIKEAAFNRYDVCVLA